MYMERALMLAEKGRCTVSPNPMVGCVMVREDKIIGEGWHQQAGGPHAEIMALNEIQQSGENAHNADVYVTLEPCCHFGRTPPCTNALIQAGVKKVFIACQDPNPLVAGQGIKALNDASIETEIGMKNAEALQLNKIFFHFITHQRPYVIAKWAMSLDGKTITHPEDNRIISDERCHAHAQDVRQTVDAILVGANTARQDNPQLTARINGQLAEKQPKRIILLGQGDLSLDCYVFSEKLPGKTLVVVSEKMNKDWIKKAEKHNNIDILRMPCLANLQVDIHGLLKKLGENNITSLLVEGGEHTRNHFFQAHCVDEIQAYLSPVFIGDLKKKEVWSGLESESLGESLFIQTTKGYKTCSAE